MAIWLHTHPGHGASPRPSARDFEVDRRLSDVFRLRTDAAFYGALILSRDGEDVRFAGHIDDGQAKASIDRLWLVGPELRLKWNDERLGRPALSAEYDRQIRAFGAHIQEVIGAALECCRGMRWHRIRRCGATGPVGSEAARPV